MDGMMTSVNAQIQRDISDVITNQILPRIQNALKCGSGHLTQNRWNVPAEGSENNSEDKRSGKIRENLRSEPIRERFYDETTDQAHDMVT